jgi:hypothetical protein
MTLFNEPMSKDLVNQSETRGELSITVAALLIAALSACLYILKIQSGIPNVDEIWRTNVAQFSWQALMAAPFDASWARYLGFFPWGYIFLLKITGLGSDSIVAVRVISSLFHLSIIWLILRSASGMPRRTFLGLTAVFIFHTGLLWMAQEAKEFSLLSLSLVMGTLSISRWALFGKRRQLFCGCALFAAAGTLHPVAIMAGTSIMIVLTASVEQRREIRKPALMLAVSFLIILTPAIYHIIFSERPAEVVFNPGYAPLSERLLLFLPRAIKDLIYNEYCLKGSGYLAFPVLLLAVFGFRLTPSRHRRHYLPSLAVLGILGFLWALQLIRPTWVFPRYVLPAAPLLLWSLVFALSHLPRMAGTFALLLVIIPNLLGSLQLMDRPNPAAPFIATFETIDGAPTSTGIYWEDAHRYLVARIFRPHRRHIWVITPGRRHPGQWTIVWKNLPGSEYIVNLDSVSKCTEEMLVAKQASHTIAALKSAGFIEIEPTRPLIHFRPPQRRTTGSPPVAP